ncbi:MAG: RNA-binding protein [Cytophagales bacterium]|nr:RNA-binding protein [Cytophagales bacterium]
MNIFVAKLSSETTREHLADAFGQYGTVSSAKVIIDRETQESKCFGFVEMDNDNEAMIAIEQLDGFSLNGRRIVVKEAKPREVR